MTQMQRVLTYCEEHGTITRRQAMLDLGIANLTALMSDIRRHPYYEVATQRKATLNRYGEKCEYTEYTVTLSEMGRRNEKAEREKTA